MISLTRKKSVTFVSAISYLPYSTMVSVSMWYMQCMCQCAYVCLHLCSACVCVSPVFDRMLSRRTLMIYLGFSRMLCDSYCWLFRSRFLDPMLDVWCLSTTLLSSLSTFRTYIYWDCTVGHSERTCNGPVGHSKRTCTETVQWDIQNVHVMRLSSGTFKTCNDASKRSTLGTCLCTLWKSQTGLHWSSGVFRTGLCTLSKSQTGLHWSSGVFRTGLFTLSKSRTGLVGYSKRAIVPCRNLRLA